MKRWFSGQSGRPARFMLVGLWNTLFGYGIFCAFNALFSRIFAAPAAAYMPATVISNVLAIINAFIFHRKITFRSQSTGLKMLAEFFRFSCTYLVLFALSLILMPVLVEIFKVKPYIAAAIVITAIACGSYLAHAKFSFKETEGHE